MIETFEIRNFKSILDVTVDFRYGEGSAPRHYLERDTWAFLQEGNGKNARFVPVLAIYGANASGKSNIVNAFLNFQQILLHGIGGRYLGNKLNAKYDYASFAATVFLEGRRFRYEIAYDGERIRQEQLCELEGSREHLLFSVASGKNAFDGVVGEGYDSGRMETALKVECTNGAGVFVRPFLSPFPVKNRMAKTTAITASTAMAMVPVFFMVRSSCSVCSHVTMWICEYIITNLPF